MLDEAIKAVHAAGFRLMLSEDSRGGWQAMALGDHPEMTPTGAMYTRAIASGKTAGESLSGLIARLAEKKAEAETVQEDDYGDLC